MGPVFWAIKEAMLQISFSNVNLSSSVTPRSWRELETFKLRLHKVKGGWSVLGQLIVIECMLWGLSFFPHIEHYDLILNECLFKELATFIWLSAYKIILFLRSFHILVVSRMKSNETKTLPCGTPKTTDLNRLIPINQKHSSQLVKKIFKCIKIDPPTPFNIKEPGC